MPTRSSPVEKHAEWLSEAIFGARDSLARSDRPAEIPTFGERAASWAGLASNSSTVRAAVASVASLLIQRLATSTLLFDQMPVERLKAVADANGAREDFLSGVKEGLQKIDPQSRLVSDAERAVFDYCVIAGTEVARRGPLSKLMNQEHLELWRQKFPMMPGVKK